MALLNYDDVERQLHAAGLIIKDALQVGTVKPVRCRVEGGDKERRGWYRLYEMPLDSGDSLLVGSYGVWQGNDNGATKIELPKLGRERMTVAQAEALKARMLADRKAAAAELAQQHERAAVRAARGWAQCSREAGENAYLTRKGLPPGRLYGARITKQGNLVIPIGDARGKVWGLQVIYSDPAVKAKKGRDKDYWPTGLAKQAHFHLIGLVGRGSIVLLCEGFATGATLHEATGLPVAIAFDAGNLLPVAKALAAAHKGIRILVCADDDWLQKCRACGHLTPVDDGPACAHCGEDHGTQNPGVTAAAAAAMAVGGAWVRPEFPAQRPADKKGDTDFNDLHVHPQGGLRLVSEQISAALAEQGWRVAPTRAAPPPAQQGEGEGGGRRQAVAVMDLDSLVERFVSIDDGTGEFVFDTWTNKLARFSQLVRLLPQKTRVDDLKAHPVWNGRAYYMDQVGFDPSGRDANVKLNTWQGWPIQPAPAESAEAGCKRLLGVLRYLCGEDNGEEVYWWLLRWLAYPLQNPGAKMASAIIMHGPQGTGKSTFFQSYAKIFGDYATVLNQRGLEDKFNSDWTDSKLFLLAEEVVTRQEMWHIKNELKELVTGEWVRVNTKQVAAYRQRNQINLVFLSNEGMPLPLDNDDRRHLVVWTPPQREPAFYDAVNAEIDAGGIACLYRYLLELPLEDFHPKKRPPNTQAKAELIQVSKTSELRFVDEWLGRELPLPLSPCVALDLYGAYLTWCRRNGEKFPRASNQFLNLVGRLVGWEKSRKRIRFTVNDVQMEQQISVVIPAPDALERSNAARPATETEPPWLGRWCKKFSDAADEYAKEETWQARKSARPVDFPSETEPA
jgi:putative DNA primase/helicase